MVLFPLFNYEAMKRTVSIGVNSVPKYLYYIPLLRWAWKQFNWDTFIFHIGESNSFTRLIDRTCEGVTFPVRMLSQFNYPTETIAQMIRFYAYAHTEDLIMTSDSDIIPLSDYWHPNNNEITCYGRDLSDEHFPACYVAMSSAKWCKMMNGHNSPATNAMNFDLREFYPKAKNKWCVDQNILTHRLNSVEPKTLINRGVDPKTGYPIGRIDRSAWTLNHSQFVDCHAPHDILTNEKSFHNVMELLHFNWPKEDFKWYIEFHKEFKKLL